MHSFENHDGVEHLSPEKCDVQRKGCPFAAYTSPLNCTQVPYTLNSVHYSPPATPYTDHTEARTHAASTEGCTTRQHDLHTYFTRARQRTPNPNHIPLPAEADHPQPPRLQCHCALYRPSPCHLRLLSNCSPFLPQSHTPPTAPSSGITARRALYRALRWRFRVPPLRPRRRQRPFPADLDRGPVLRRGKRLTAIGRLTTKPQRVDGGGGEGRGWGK